MSKTARKALNRRLKAVPKKKRDSLLVESARKGEPAAIERIYEDNIRDVERFIFRMKLPNWIDNTDIAAEVLEKFLTETIDRAPDSPGGFRGDAAIKTFLFGNAVNLAKNARSLGALKETSIDAQVGGRTVEGETQTLHETVPAPNSNLTQAAINSQLGAKMGEALENLPKNYRDIVERVMLEGKSYEQTAHELGIPIGTVRSGYSRAKESLQGKLGEYTKQSGQVDPTLLAIAGLSGTAAALGAYLDEEIPCAELS